MTKFGAITQSPEALVKFIRYLNDMDIEDEFCQMFNSCEARLEAGVDIPESECDECLLVWLDKEAEIPA